MRYISTLVLVLYCAVSSVCQVDRHGYLPTPQRPTEGWVCGRSGFSQPPICLSVHSLGCNSIGSTALSAKVSSSLAVLSSIRALDTVEIVVCSIGGRREDEQPSPVQFISYQSLLPADQRAVAKPT
jgi:hypothetical protein